ncbi:MAG TPA: prepilin-type N-terminal cleavage/methylation domain-containing protein [Planctomycetota bacterium]|nr:prepilin-type N-terminal cleavage/methylation domain-containing protein [Planctomycetota bacterium]
MTTIRQQKKPAGFTLIELLVAISVSVVLLSVLAFVFQISTAATRDANSRVALTERLRSLNIRMRQEVGAMLPVQRFQSPSKTFANKRTFDIDTSSTPAWIVFATATQENGRPVSVDVKYEYIPDAGNPNGGKLVRWRDATGPYKKDFATGQWVPNDKYTLGDNETTSWEPRTDADVMVTNVRRCVFEVIDVPESMKTAAAPTTPVTELNPRELPSAVMLTIEFGAEVGNPDMRQTTTMTFPVYRGL